MYSQYNNNIIKKFLKIGRKGIDLGFSVSILKSKDILNDKWKGAIYFCLDIQSFNNKHPVLLLLST
jgi:hypothetical protein